MSWAIRSTLACPGAHHEVVVGGVVGDVAVALALLQAADPVLETRPCRARPTGGPASPRRAGRARTRLVALRVGVVGLGGEVRVDRRAGRRPRGSATARSRWRDSRRRAAHGRAVGDRDPGGLDGGVEAVGRRLRRDHRHRRLAVAAEHHLQQVGLLGLGGQAGGRPTALYVDHEQRQLHHHGEADRLGLQRDARAGRRGDPERAAERRAEGRARCRRSRPRPGTS